MHNNMKTSYPIEYFDISEICDDFPLKGIGVSKSPLYSTEWKPNRNHIDSFGFFSFDYYRQDNRKNYSPKHVEENFKKVQEFIGKPDGISRCIFLSVKLKGKKSRHWDTSNNALNALDMKTRRKFWRNKWCYMNTFMGCIEKDANNETYHFHALVIFKDLKSYYSDEHLKDFIIDTVKSLEETNEKDVQMVKVCLFPFCDKTNHLGRVIHYLVKQSSSMHNPLERRIYSRKQLRQYENRTIINHIPQKEGSPKTRTA